MTFGDVVTIVAGMLVTGLLLLFFFGPKRSQRAELRGGVQEVEVTVRGGYSPDVIRARWGSRFAPSSIVKSGATARRACCFQTSV